MRIQKHTSRALLLSLCGHIALMFVVSVFLAHHFDTEQEHISAEILEVVRAMKTMKFYTNPFSNF